MRARGALPRRRHAGGLGSWREERAQLREYGYLPPCPAHIFHGSTLHTLDTLCVGGLILFWCDSGRLGVLGN